MESALSARADARKHTGESGCILTPGEPGGTPGVLRAACLQPCDYGGYVAEHPAASSSSASYCLRIALSSRRGGDGGGGGGQQRGGPSPSLLLCPITAQLRREPLLFAVSVQTMPPSGAVGNIPNSCRDLCYYYVSD